MVTGAEKVDCGALYWLEGNPQIFLAYLVKEFTVGGEKGYLHQPVGGNFVADTDGFERIG